MGFGSRLVLAVAAALVALATAGTSFAVAETGVMCKAKEEKCSEKNTYPAKTKFSAQPAEGLEIVFETSEWRTRCGEASLAGISTSSTGGEVTTMSFPFCKALKEPAPIQECYSVEARHLPYSVKFFTNEKETEKGIGAERMRLSSGGSGDPGFKFNCQYIGFKYWCSFTEKELELVLVGGEPAEIRVNHGLLKLSESSPESLCGTTLEMAWNAIYTVSTPSPLFFRAM